VNIITVPFANEIALQELLRPALTPVGSNVDYRQAKRELDDIDRLLASSGLEAAAVAQALKGKEGLSAKRTEKIALFAIQSVRTETLRWYLGGLSFRALSKAICASDLYARFCRVIDIAGIRGVSKSSLERSSKLFDVKQIDSLLSTLSQRSFSAEQSAKIGLQKPLDASAVLVDGTCLEANVHHPVDWVAIKDCAHTLLKSVRLIRTLGLVNRMPRTPAQLASDMNKLCIAFSNTHRRKDGKKTRKTLLRKMLKLVETAAGHARTHARLLCENMEKVDRSVRQCERIVQRVNSNIELLPQLKKQARERIIGERQIPAKDKILSIHDLDICVTSKGKSGKPAEFGNHLLVGETLEGFIIDSKLHRGQPPGEPRQLPDCLKRIKELGVKVQAVVTDRGFSSANNSNDLDEKIYDATAPRCVNALDKRLEEDRFRELQKRRGSTESRIATLKNRWQGGRIKAKGFDNRERALKGSILARTIRDQDQRKKAA
jgi:hypothetical protein